MIIFRYLCKEVYYTMAAIVLILLVILLSQQFIHYLNKAAVGHIPVMTVIKVIGLELPLFIGYLLPSAIFLGILLTLGRMYSEREITVCFACGYTPGQLLRSLLSISLLTMLLAALLLFWVEPKAQWYRIKVLDQAVANYSIQKLSPQRFQSLQHSGWHFFAAKKDKQSQGFRQVFMARRQKPSSSFPDGAWALILAKQLDDQRIARYDQDYIVLQKGNRYVLSAGEHTLKRISFDRYAMHLDPVSAASSKKDQVKFASSFALWQQRAEPMVNAELQWRLAIPLSVVILSLLAVPLSQVQPRQGRYAKLFPGVLLFLFYENLLFMARSWISSGKLSPELGMWWIHGVMLLLVLFLLARWLGWSWRRRFVS